MYDFPGNEPYYRVPRGETAGRFDLPDLPKPESVTTAHDTLTTLQIQCADAIARWGAYAEAHQYAADEDMNAEADALANGDPLPVETVAGELKRLHHEATVACRAVDRARHRVAQAIDKHRAYYVELLMDGGIQDAAEYDEHARNTHESATRIGERADALDFVSNFDLTDWEWASFAPGSRRARIVTDGTPRAINLDMDTDVFDHLHRDVEAMRATFGPVAEDPTEDPVAMLDDPAGRTVDDEPEPTDEDLASIDDEDPTEDAGAAA